MNSALIVLSLLVLGQWVLIWKLIDRLLVQNRIPPTLGPFPTTPPPDAIEHPDARKKLFSTRVLS